VSVVHRHGLLAAQRLTPIDHVGLVFEVSQVNRHVVANALADPSITLRVYAHVVRSERASSARPVSPASWAEPWAREKSRCQHSVFGRAAVGTSLRTGADSADLVDLAPRSGPAGGPDVALLVVGPAHTGPP
jgi:hypothetical protein